MFSCHKISRAVRCGHKTFVFLLIPMLSACIVMPDTTDEVLHDWKKHVNIARALLKEKQADNAKAEYQKAIEIVDKDKELQIFVALTKREEGLLYLNQKQPEKAAAKFSEAAKIFLAERKRDADTYSIYTRQHFDSLYQLALIEKADGKKDAAIKHMHEALWADNSNEKSEECKDQLLMLESSEVTKGLSKEVFATVRDLALKSSTDGIKPDPVISAADELLRKGEVEKAEAYIEALLELGRRKKDYNVQVGATIKLITIMYQLGRLDAAAKLAREAVALANTNEIYASFHSSFLAQQSLITNRQLDGKGETASIIYAQALQAAETDKQKHRLATMLEIFALIDQTEGRFKLAQDALGKAVQVLLPLPDKPDYTRIEIEFGSALVDGGEPQAAKGYLQEGLDHAKSAEDKFRASLSLSKAFLRLNKLGHAVKYAETANANATSAFSRAEAKIALANCSLAKKDREQAQKELQAASLELQEVKKTCPPKAFEMLEATCQQVKDQIDGD